MARDDAARCRCWPLFDALASAATLLLLVENDPSSGWEHPHADLWQLLLPAFHHPVVCPLEIP